MPAGPIEQIPGIVEPSMGDRPIPSRNEDFSSHRLFHESGDDSESRTEVSRNPDPWRKFDGLFDLASLASLDCHGLVEMPGKRAHPSERIGRIASRPARMESHHARPAPRDRPSFPCRVHRGLAQPGPSRRPSSRGSGWFSCSRPSHRRSKAIAREAVSQAQLPPLGRTEADSAVSAWLDSGECQSLGK